MDKVKTLRKSDYFHGEPFRLFDDRFIWYISLHSVTPKSDSWGGNNNEEETTKIRIYLNSLCTKFDIQELDTITIKIDVEFIYIGKNGIAEDIEKIGKNEMDKKETLNEDVRSWLCDVVGLEEYEQLFFKQRIDSMDIVKLLTIDYIKEMGISKVGHQIKLLSKIKLL